MKLYAFALFAVVGCSNAPSAPPPEQKVAEPKKPVAPKLVPAPTSRWSSSNLQLESKDTVDGKKLHYDARVSLYMAYGVLHIGPANLPVGTVIEIGEHRYETKSEHGNNWDLPMDREIADSPWSSVQPVGKYSLAAEVDWNLPLVITLPGREPLRTMLPKMKPAIGLDKLYIEMATTPRGWPDDKPSSPVPEAAAWTFVQFTGIGKADKVRDVRMIAVAAMIDNNRTRCCSGYIGAGDFTATSYDVELSIIDRLTKEKLATKKFTGQPSCPQTVMTTNGAASAHSGPSHKTMQAWVKSQLAPLAKKL